MRSLWWAVADPSTYSWSNLGLAGLVVVTIVIPMALYIIRDKERQLRAKDVEIERMRQEGIKFREVMESFPPVIQDMTRTLGAAVTIVERSRLS